ncbi:MAG: hypothetical protein LKJ91_07940, partial [Acidaminococcus sp.]|nr:hypothetical protein [Acidaminococcus sp.]MCI2115281.1 hypothetical protein [Acidaminococcus sp.]MCI2117316.1 hypothetical protein [Acidaminococcus sp.]
VGLFFGIFKFYTKARSHSMRPRLAFTLFLIQKGPSQNATAPLRWSSVAGRGSLVEEKLRGHFSTNL